MRRFLLGFFLYLGVCLVAAAVIVMRGEGPRPQIVSLYPFDGDQYWPGGPAQITFSASMDHSSVERGLQVSPASQGQGAWYGNTLNLQPVGGWKPNVTYHVALVGKVTDDEGRPLHTPFSFSFRVHEVGRLAACSVEGVRTVCEPAAPHHSLIPTRAPILTFALSPDRTLIAYTRRDGSGLPHLFVIGTDGTGNRQLTGGRQYADSNPLWTPGDSIDVAYTRRPVRWVGGTPRLGKGRLWSVTVAGANNSPL